MCLWAHSAALPAALCLGLALLEFLGRRGWAPWSAVGTATSAVGPPAPPHGIAHSSIFLESCFSRPWW